MQNKLDTKLESLNFFAKSQPRSSSDQANTLKLNSLLPGEIIREKYAKMQAKEMSKGTATKQEKWKITLRVNARPSRPSGKRTVKSFFSALTTTL